MSEPIPTLEADMQVLRATFRERGFERIPRARMVAVVAVLLAVGHGLLALALFTQRFWVGVVAVFLAGYCLLASATNGHTASHGALTGSDRLDRFLTWVTYPLALGLSGRYWVHSHVQVHHSAPNVVAVDDDCDLAPTFRLTDAEIAAASAFLRPLFRFQLVWLALLLPFNSVTYQLQGFRHLARDFAHGKRHRAACLRDLLAIVVHFAFRFGVPLALSVPIGRVLAVYYGWAFFMSYGMFLVLAPGHYPHAARSIATSQRRAGSFFLRQAVATANFRTGPIGALLCSGLEYQIEHHLFPRYCHVHYAKMAPLVRAVLERHGVPYASFGWGEAIYETLRTFAMPKPVIHDVAALVARAPGDIEPAPVSHDTAPPEARTAISA